MSYCRMEGTFQELSVCKDKLDCFINERENCISSEGERNYAKKLIALCREIADNFSETDIDFTAETLEEERYL